MQTTSRILDDIAKLGMGLFGIAVGVKDELKQRSSSRFGQYARDMDLATREEFEVVREMAQQARMQVDELQAELSKSKSKNKK